MTTDKGIEAALEARGFKVKDRYEGWLRLEDANGRMEFADGTPKQRDIADCPVGIMLARL